jgi:hypothetical protein
MAQQVGDLWPYASGTASLGVDQANGQGGFSNEIRPFAHVHLNSGVLHDPMHGTSGVIRFNGYDAAQGQFEEHAPVRIPSFEMSFDGGLNYDLVLGQSLGGPFADGIVVVQSLNAKDLQLKASGILQLLAESEIHMYSLHGDIIIDAAGTAASVADIHMTATNSVTVTADNAVAITAGLGNLDLTAGFTGDATLATARGDVEITAGVANNAGGQISLDAFNGSGQLEYRFGPHESWYMKQTHSSTSGPFGDGFNPIVASGAIVQMIAAAPLPTLQEVYNNSNVFTLPYPRVPLITNEGPIYIEADDGERGLVLSIISDDSTSPLTITPAYIAYTHSNDDIGDMYMYGNTYMSDGRNERVTTEAESQAASIGPGVLSVNTGSGIVPLALASGITEFVNIGSLILPDDTVGDEIPWTSAGNQFKDSFYHILNNSKVVTILVPGLYLATYKVSLTKIDGNQRSTVSSSLLLDGDTVVGSTSSAYLRNTVDNINTANGCCMFNAEPGSEIAVHVEKFTNLSEGVEVLTRECTLILQYICPPRGGVSVI